MKNTLKNTCWWVDFHQSVPNPGLVPGLVDHRRLVTAESPGEAEDIIKRRFPKATDVSAYPLDSAPPNETPPPPPPSPSSPPSTKG